MKYLLVAVVLLGAVGVGSAHNCYNCIYNISHGAPTHNPRCGDPFDETMIATGSCPIGQTCAKYPAYLGDNSGSFVVSIERRCAVNTGDGCIKFSDEEGGYLKICGYFCDTDLCNNAGIVTLNLSAIFAILLAALFVVFE